MDVFLEFASGVSDDEAEGAARQKSYCDWALVRLESGERYHVYFTTVDEAAYKLRRLKDGKHPYLAISATIVVDDLLITTMRSAARFAFEIGFFSRLRPMTDTELDLFNQGIEF